MIVSKDAEKPYDKIQHPLIINILNSQQTSNRRQILQSDKGQIQKHLQLTSYLTVKHWILSP